MSDLEKINKVFLESLRLVHSRRSWNYKDVNKNESFDIVPEEFTHFYLLNNNIIGENISKFYYLSTSRYISDAEYKKMTYSDYIGEQGKTLDPYPFCINGAYHSRISLYNKLMYLEVLEEKPYLNGKNNLEYFEDFVPYFNEYAQGFKDGYNEFESRIIKPYLPMFPDKNDFIDKVHQYITKKIIYEHDWLNNNKAFSIEFGRNNKDGEIAYAFEDGQTQGYFYRAWSIVFSNNQLFEPLFKEKVLELNDNVHNVEPVESNVKHPEHDPNIFNKDGFELFKYLFDNYYKKYKRELMNIWFYLKEYDPNKYTLLASKDQYKAFVLKNYQITITNDEKAKYAYNDKAYPIMNNHRVNFEKRLK